MRKSSRRVLEVAMLAAILCSGPGFAQTGSPEGEPRQDRQDMRQDRRDIRQDRQDVQGDRRDLRQDNRDIRADRQDMRQDEGALRHDRQQLQHDEHSGASVGQLQQDQQNVSKAIVAMYEPIARTGREIVTICGQMDGTCIGIGRT
jgi:hypothetical protein